MDSFDVVIIGAGLSGINCAYRLQAHAPDTRFTVLEARSDLGGTWDFFRFPGVRSDSDLCSMGFAWHPWPHKQVFAEGPLIMEYIRDAVRKHNLSQHFRFQQKVTSAGWSSEAQKWQLLVVDGQGQTRRVEAGFLVLGTGYFDYSTPLATDIPGLDTFEGKIIHPQFWPSKYNYDGQRIAIIGSGATAVTLVPRLGEHAAQVTMVQRSPTYIGAKPNGTPLSPWARKVLPLAWVAAWDRLYHVVTCYLLVVFCRRFPQAARGALLKGVGAALPAHVPVRPHFEPRYLPWEQRLCLAPDGDFFAALHRGNTRVVTGEIEAVGARGLRMRDGTRVDADVIVTATGMRMRLGGGVDLRLDGGPVAWAGRAVWNGAMLDGVPNMVFMLGYTDASWTLGADDAAWILVRILRHARSKQASSVTPRAPRDAVEETRRVWPLDATYRRQVEDEMPVYGSKGPWRPSRLSPIADYVHARWGNVTEGLVLQTMGSESQEAGSE